MLERPRRDCRESGSAIEKVLQDKPACGSTEDRPPGSLEVAPNRSLDAADKFNRREEAAPRGTRLQVLTVFTDNSTAQAWVNRQGSTHAPQAAMDLVQELHTLLASRNLIIKAEFTPGRANIHADRLSRNIEVPPTLTEQLLALWGPANTIWEGDGPKVWRGYSSDSTYVPSEDLDLVDIPPRERHYVARVAPPQAGSSPEALLLDNRAPERHEVEVHRSGPSNLFEGIRLSDQLSHLEEQGRRAVAGWVTKFIESRDPKLSHAAQFRAFLLKEGRNSGPDSVGRKAYWVIQAAPRWSSWRVPLDAQAIQKEARKRATLKGLTGGSRPVYRIEMSDAIANRNSSIRAYQATLFASMCYLTVSRGREIFTLTPGRITFEPNGDATLGIPRTKTMIGVAKRLPNVWILGFNPAKALQRWLTGLSLPDDACMWREVTPRNTLSRRNPRSARGLLQDVKRLFGPRSGWHSFRKGAASELALCGTPLEALLAMGTWREVRSLRSYIGQAMRNEPLFVREATRSLLRPSAKRL
ncbi:hypothetical protein J8273_5915 [Carpediemonas membranifera]|uniref:Uncharacterized protein n=1 Tax=Carpediemonas membranifera TaxID=201153 RepID=A0A8J6B9I4_9EUKA|nr:hypothetical protein J8273_5915 [Carpediemonas membranifera]|eukprot:KAG9392772.1 hypothetical protein J8273_5915 [Carpediemonas membranifera]